MQITTRIRSHQWHVLVVKTILTDTLSYSLTWEKETSRMKDESSSHKRGKIVFCIPFLTGNLIPGHVSSANLSEINVLFLLQQTLTMTSTQRQRFRQIYSGYMYSRLYIALFLTLVRQDLIWDVLLQTQHKFLILLWQTSHQIEDKFSELQ